MPDTPPASLAPHPLLRAESEQGSCRVICFSPRHDLTLPELTQAQVEAVVKTWTEQTVELGGLEYIHYVQVFENKGAMMGCSNPHPHGQIWAGDSLPDEPAKEDRHQRRYLAEHGQRSDGHVGDGERRRRRHVALAALSAAHGCPARTFE